MSRALLRSVLELRTPMTRLPAPFLLPMGTRRFLTTTTTEPSQPAQPSIPPTGAIENAGAAASPPSPSELTAGKAASTKTQAPLYPKQTQKHTDLSPEHAATISQLLPLLKTQPQHYITAHIWGRPYLVTPGDQIRLPFKMPGVLPGDVLRLDRASTLGSRDYTLKGAPYIDERLFECRATVLGTETEPLRVKIKAKRRQRRHKHVKSKHKYTILRISDLVVKGPEAVGL